MKRLIAVALIAFGLCSTAETAAADTHRVGYIGCSMTNNLFAGAARLDPATYWAPDPDYDIGGATLKTWSNPAHPVWDEFEAKVARSGQPTIVVVMVCVNKQAGSATNTQLEQVVAHVDSIVNVPGQPFATIVTAAQPSYSAGHVCNIIGNTQAQADAQIARSQAVSDYGPAAGAHGTIYPHLGPLTPSNPDLLQDLCHANTAGQDVLAAQLDSRLGI